jgi:hypothetical protein
VFWQIMAFALSAPRKLEDLSGNKELLGIERTWPAFLGQFFFGQASRMGQTGSHGFHPPLGPVCPGFLKSLPRPAWPAKKFWWPSHIDLRMPGDRRGRALAKLESCLGMLDCSVFDQSAVASSVYANFSKFSQLLGIAYV